MYSLSMIQWTRSFTLSAGGFLQQRQTTTWTIESPTIRVVDQPEEPVIHPERQVAELTAGSGGILFVCFRFSLNHPGSRF